MKIAIKVAAAGLVAVVAARAVCAAEGQPTSSATPPKNLKLVGDHWTPWDPPQPAEGAYTIVKGDTLWDLSGTWLGNPYLWPQVWDQNRYILDSHWIYPGDPLNIPGRPQVVPPEGPPSVSEDTSGEVPPEQAAAEATDTGRSVARTPAMIQLADAYDLYCSGWIAPKHEPSLLTIVGGERERDGQADDDIVYLNQGSNQGVTAGSEYRVVRPTYAVSHPRTEESLGTFVRRLGHLRVLCTQEDTSIAVVLDACEEILAGDELVPWQEMVGPAIERLPTADRCDPSTGLAQGYIVSGGPNRLSFYGAGHVVNSDLGTSAGIRPGSVLTLYQDNGDLPRMVTGEAVVLTVDGDTSTIKVIRSSRDVRLGDRVEVLQQ